jgi:hypothetical protein
MWQQQRPFAFTPVPRPSQMPLGLQDSLSLPICIEKIRANWPERGESRRYNERLSRINLYAPAHNKPSPFKSSQKANHEW